MEGTSWGREEGEEVRKGGQGGGGGKGGGGIKRCDL